MSTELQNACVEPDEGTRPEVALLLSDWWTRPGQDRINRWEDATFSAQARLLVGAHCANAIPVLDCLLTAVADERDQLAQEYERLFVGPAAVPCPPYEAVWRTDRPAHEQRTIIGPSTELLKRLYEQIGLRLRRDHAELADHVGIQLEALAYAMRVAQNPHVSDEIEARLRNWLPPFCASVIQNSTLEFYRALSELTLLLLPSGEVLDPPLQVLQQRRSHSQC